MWQGPGREPMVDKAGAMEYLGVKRTYLYYRTASGDIPSYKVGGKIWYKVADLDAYIESRLQKKGE